MIQNKIELLPHIINRSLDKCIWAFHDMKDNNINEVLKNSNSMLIERSDSLGVFLYQETEKIIEN